MSDHKLQPARGTKDLFGNEIKIFNHIIATARKKSEFFGFEELQTPIFEFSEVFERNLGEASDIVAKEVYKFQDRSENFITLRPEFTAGVVRALISNGELMQILPRKFFSYGPIFRYDRPQKGRQRQFNQINFEIFGEKNYLQDVEAIALAAEILHDLGILDRVELQINSLGCAKTKAKDEEALKKYFIEFQNKLSEDSKIRLQKNPLRILDSKDFQDIELCQNTPLISDFYSDDAKKNFDKILQNLDEAKIKYVVNSRLVRGLDYYTSCVFEFIMEVETAQNTVLAGGRYDSLVEKMGGKETPAIGFAAGVERLMMLMNFVPEKSNKLMVIYVDEAQQNHSFKLAQKLRNAGFEVDFIFDTNFKKQMKKASQNGVRFVLILGEDEVVKSEITVKDFKNSSEQKIKQGLIIPYLEGKF